jgi:hypothetical protein
MASCFPVKALKNRLDSGVRILGSGNGNTVLKEIMGLESGGLELAGLGSDQDNSLIERIIVGIRNPGCKTGILEYRNDGIL